MVTNPLTKISCLAAGDTPPAQSIFTRELFPLKSMGIGLSDLAGHFQTSKVVILSLFEDVFVAFTCLVINFHMILVIRFKVIKC